MNSTIKKIRFRHQDDIFVDIISVLEINLAFMFFSKNVTKLLVKVDNFGDLYLLPDIWGEHEKVQKYINPHVILASSCLAFFRIFLISALLLAFLISALLLGPGF